ncbi:argininosuccinate lyase [Buchnera aphidicola (Cinara tujafilina)]|uniref:Argininosuccinate lyase n=1 Tax=Buchnera aphidicola (Cinara tujafilina) TaxID=261317 RepID=F7WYX7_9GAMM|nr:argininosuccinate lyase [Buchnera aphidicola (Cinara tujafilina)]
MSVDYRLVEEDIISSIAWSRILLDIGILTDIDQKLIEKTLSQILKDNIDDTNKILSSQAEDIHSWLETTLINKLGSLGKKLYTGRSRNDQIATTLKLWCKKKLNHIYMLIIQLQSDFLDQATIHVHTIMPGYTHLQRAQPITFAFWCLAYIEMFERDRKRIKQALKNSDFSPLGSGAISGTSWVINRKKLAQIMGFANCTSNALDSVSDRDFILEILSVASISMMHLSRFSEDLIFYNSGETNFIGLSDSITSGSSLMPQKKNPDILELIRGKCSAVYGSLFSMFTLLKGLPLSYNKDFQEDKKHLFSALDTWEDCLTMASVVLKNITVNIDICKRAAEKGYSNATEVADYLVNKGVSFRDSHDIVGQIILEAIRLNKSLKNLDISVYQKYHINFSNDIYKCLTLKSCLDKRNSYGGVSFEQTEKSICFIKKRLNKIKNILKI